MLFFCLLFCVTLSTLAIVTVYEDREDIYVFLRKSVFSKIYWKNRWHLFLIFIKFKQKLTFPFDMKKYIAKNALIQIQIKLFKSSKQFQQIIQRHRGKQCGEFYLRNDEFTFFLDATNITMEMHWTDIFLSKDNPLSVKEIFSTITYSEGITNQILDDLYPKLDLTEVKKIEIDSIILNKNTFWKYLVPSLIEIRLTDVFVENVDIPLILLEQCLMATTIIAHWNSNLTSMSKLAAVKRKTKLKRLVLRDIFKIIHIQDIINFINNQMVIDSERVLSLEKELYSSEPHNEFQGLSWEEIEKILTENNIPSFEIFISCTVTK